MSFDPTLTTKRILRKLGGDKISGKVLTLSVDDLPEDLVQLPNGCVKVTDEVVDLTKAKKFVADVGDEVLVFTDFTFEDVGEGSINIGMRMLVEGEIFAVTLLEPLGEFPKGTYLLPAQVKATLEIAETVHPIDPKYIPPVDSLVMNGADGKQYKLTVNNGAISVSEVV